MSRFYALLPLCGGMLVLLALSFVSHSAAPSQKEAIIPPAAKIVDSSNNVWTVKDGQVYRNGVADTATGQTTMLWCSKGAVIKRMIGSTRFCAWARLKTADWPAGESGWEQLPLGYGIFKRDCPQLLNERVKK